MPLRSDAEYGAELEKIRTRAMAENRQFSRVSFVAIFFLLYGCIWYFSRTSISDGSFISIIVALSTLSMVWVINSAVRAVHLPLMVLIAATEWVGCKQLGEYEAPGARE